MKKSPTSDPGRRHFLKTATRVIALGAAAPVALDLAGIQAAAAQTAGDDRALVCVFLFGGNDQTSTLVPFDNAEFSALLGSRSSIARPSSGFVSLGAVASQGNGSFALAQELAPLAKLYAQRKVVIVANVGPMYKPLTKAQYHADAAGVPPASLPDALPHIGNFSVNDIRLFAQRLQPRRWRGQRGFGEVGPGRLADLGRRWLKG